MTQAPTVAALPAKSAPAESKKEEITYAQIEQAQASPSSWVPMRRDTKRLSVRSLNLLLSPKSRGSLHAPSLRKIDWEADEYPRAKGLVQDEGYVVVKLNKIPIYRRRTFC